MSQLNTPPETPYSPAALPLFEATPQPYESKIPASLAELAAKYPPKFMGLGKAVQAPRLPEQPLSSVLASREETDQLVVETVEHLLADSSDLTDESARTFLITRHPELSEQVVTHVLGQVSARLHGLGRLEPLLATPGVTDIYVNSPHEVWIDGAHGMQRAQIYFRDEDEVRELAVRLVTSAGGRLDDSVPANDVQNRRGQRIHAVLPPVAHGHTVLSIRLQPKRRLTFEQWMRYEPDELAEVLIFMVNSRANFLVSGGTGSGKTTLLNALLGLCPPDERLITLEDSPELAPSHPHVLALLTKEANAEGRGAINLQDLMQQSLRMGPDRLVLGESRGAEVIDLLMAMNTGHSGSGSTVHANSAEAVPARLLAMGALAGLGSEATSLQAATALDYVIHCEKRGGKRRVTAISSLHLNAGRLVAQPCCLLDEEAQQLVWQPGGHRLYRKVFGCELEDTLQVSYLPPAGVVREEHEETQC